MLEMASKLCEDEKYTQALKYYEDVLLISFKGISCFVKILLKLSPRDTLCSMLIYFGSRLLIMICSVFSK